MSVESMMAEGLYLMVVGMGFVIGFLSLLVLLLNLMERFVDHEEVDVLTSDNQLSQSTLIAVISSAIHQHRRQSHK